MLVRLRLTTENNQIYKNGVEKMTKAIINKQTITSLELLEQINFFREKEGKKTELQHKDLLKIIRNEFDEEIHEGKISPMFRDVKIGNGATRKEPYYILSLSQGKQVLTRESKFVRRAVIHKLEELESEQPKQINTNISKLFLEMSQAYTELENRIENLEKNNTLIEYNQSFITVSEFAKMKNFSEWEYMPRNLGGKATCISKKLNLPIGRIYKHNIKDGKVKGRYFVNTYHIKALEQAYAELKQKEFDNVVITCTRPFKEV